MSAALDAGRGGFVRDKMRAYSRTPPLLRVIRRVRERERAAKRAPKKPLREHTFQEFCALLEVVNFEGERVSFAPEHWFEEQARFDRERCGRDIVVKPRQVGFSTLELARDLWYAIVRPGAKVLILVHDGDLADQLFVALHIFRETLKELGVLPATRYSNKREIVFRTGSAVRIVEAGATDQAAQKKGRSGTVHRLHATEVAFWGAAQETMRAVLSSVPTSGEVVIESTANGASGLFYEDVMAARVRDTGYKLHFFAWYEHSRYRIALTTVVDGSGAFDPAPRDDWEKILRAQGCDDEQIAWWRSKCDDPKMGLESALSEFPVNLDTCFRTAGDAWFAGPVIDALAKRVIKPRRTAPIAWEGHKFDPALIYAEFKPGLRYVVFGDVAEGVAGDGSSAHVLERKSGITAATWWSNTIEPGDFAYVLTALGWMFGGATVAWERNNHGHTVTRVLTKETKYQNLYYAEDGRYGFLTNSATRSPLWDTLAAAIREGSAWTPDAATLQECRTIIRDEDGQPRARGKRKANAGAARDDRYVSWAGAWFLRARTEHRRVTLTIPVR